MAIRYHPGAHKHGVSRADVEHVLTHARLRVHPFDADEQGKATTLFVGHSTGSVMLEVLAVLTPPHGVFVFHAMPLRDEIARRAGFYDQEGDLR